MKIAYIVNHNINKDDGVTKKIIGQIKYWEKLGCQVRVFAFLTQKGKSIIENSSCYFIENQIKLRVSLQKTLIKDIEVFSPNIIYYRYDGWIKTISTLAKKYKIVAEINTYYKGEMWMYWKESRNIKALIRYIFPENIFLSKMSGLITVTNELMEKYKYSGIPICTIPNGIDIEFFSQVKEYKSSEDSRVGLFFMGTPNQAWHGVDYIIKMAQKMPQYDFHIVGIKGESCNNLYWHGYLQKSDYIAILKKCHICIGTLALFRKNMKEACSLKVREYVAFGYPIIIGYKDTAFLDKDYSWIGYFDMQSGFDIKNIIQFIESNTIRVLSDTERKSVSLETTEELRVSFFKELSK